MNYNLERLSDAKVKLDVTLPKEDFKAAIDQAFKKVIKNVEMRGFRKGKVPREIYMQKYGEASLYEDAINFAINKSYPQVVIENELEIVNEPEFDIDFDSIGSDKEFKYSFTVEVWPNVELGQYKELEVTKDSETVTDEEVEKYIAEVLRSKAELVLVEDSTLQEGHLAIIDFEGTLDGEAFEGGTAENYSLEIGSNTFIPGFEEQLVGMELAEEKTITVTFPKDYQADNLAGKEVQFKVTLHEIKERVVPELSDEIVEELEVEDISTAEEYYAHILEKLTTEKKTLVENKFIDELVTKACENATTEVPQGLINDEMNMAVKQVEDQAKQYNLTADQLLSFNGLTLEDYKEQMLAPITKRVLERIVLRKISEVEEFEITEEEITAQYEELSEMYSQEIDQIKLAIPEATIKSHLGVIKAVELLKETAIIKE